MAKICVVCVSVGKDGGFSPLCFFVDKIGMKLTSRDAEKAEVVGD